MNRKILLKVLSVGWILMGIASCAYKPLKTPYPKRIKSKSHEYVTEGFAIEEKKRWIAYSDRADNALHNSKRSRTGSGKTLGFLEPVYVVKKNRRHQKYKVVKYLPAKDALKPRKDVELGWIDKDNLVLSSQANRTNVNRYFMRGIVSINSEKAFLHPENYVLNDSAIVFNNQKSNLKNAGKVAIGSTIYIYKDSEDGRKWFIGTAPKIEANENTQETYGWINKGLVTIINRPQYLVYKNDSKSNTNTITGDIKVLTEGPKPYNVLASKHLKPFKELSKLDQSFLVDEKLFYMPFEKIKDGYEVSFFDNPFNYSLNYILNVNGEKIRYDEFEDYVSERKKLNIVFLIDKSKNNEKYLKSMKSVLTDLGRKITDQIEPKFTHINYASVLYSDVNCDTSLTAFELNSDYQEMYKFYENQISRPLCTSNRDKNIEGALMKANQMFEGIEEQNNLVVLIGSNSGRYNNVSRNVIDELGKRNTKILAYQTHSKKLNSYINYVLLTEGLISQVSDVVSKNSKKFIVNQNRVKNKAGFDLSKSKDGIFMLDYPQNSMVQGATIYPKKGEENEYSKLITGFITVLDQIYQENQTTYTESIEDFKDFGLAKTMIKNRFEHFYPEAPQFLPVKFTRQMLSEQNKQLFTGYIEDSLISDQPEFEKVLVLNKLEYDELFRFYKAICENIDTTEARFNQFSAVNEFINIVRKHYPLSKKGMSGYKNTMSELLYQTTGFLNEEALMTDFILDQWKSSQFVKKETVRNYFASIHKIFNLMNNDQTKIYRTLKENGAYLLNEKYMPHVKMKQKLHM